MTLQAICVVKRDRQRNRAEHTEAAVDQPPREWNPADRARNQRQRGHSFTSDDAEHRPSFPSIASAAAAYEFPLLVRSARTGFEEVDPRLVGLARTLGCGPLAAFFRVTLPLAWRGVLAGTVLAFARALGEFGATIMIAGNIPGRTQTLALAIFQASQIGHDDRAQVLAGVTVLLAFATLWTAELFTRRRARRAAT